MQIRIPTPNYLLLKMKVNVVPAYVPLLLGLDVLDYEKLVANNFQNELQATDHGWSMSLARKHEHLYLTWNSKSIFLPSRKLSCCIVTSSILLPVNFTKL